MKDTIRSFQKASETKYRDVKYFVIKNGREKHVLNSDERKTDKFKLVDHVIFSQILVPIFYQIRITY